MKRSLFAIILGLMLLCGCSPKVTSSLSTARAPLGPETEVTVLDQFSPEPSGLAFLGTVKVGDTGFTATKNGSYEAVLDLAKAQALQAGGNVLRITKHLHPDGRSTIHRIEADVFWSADPSSLVVEPVSIQKSEHPDCAIIYFYRTSGIGPLVNYEVHVGDTGVYKAKVNSRAEVKIYEASDVEIWAKTEARSSIPLKLELGKEYYVRCAVTMGAFVGRPLLELVPASYGRGEYESVKSE